MSKLFKKGHYMQLTDLKLRCFAVQEQDAWVAVCLELCLAAHGDSFEDAHKNLYSMIVDYMRDALNDHEHVNDLIPRKAPLSSYCHYYFIKFVSSLVKLRNWHQKCFTEIMPLTFNNNYTSKKA